MARHNSDPLFCRRVSSSTIAVHCPSASSHHRSASTTMSAQHGCFTSPTSRTSGQQRQHGIWLPYPKWPHDCHGPTNAQGSKAKPTSWVSATKANRVSDKEIQRVASSWHILEPHREDPTSSSFVSESRPGVFH
jgi:hypothetical protein